MLSTIFSPLPSCLAPRLGALLLLAVIACDDGDASTHYAGDPLSGDLTTVGSSGPEVVIATVDPYIVDPIGLSRVVITGSGFTGATGVTIGGAPASAIEVVSDSELRVVTGPVAAGDALDVVVLRGDDVGTLVAAVDAWSPADITGARLFDAAFGVGASVPARSYEWARLTEQMHPDWRKRDGNSLTWLPATEKFWMLGGWNGYMDPNGFSPVEPDSVYPPLNTTNEVWSSPDGVQWTLNLPHDHPQWERRHAHSTVLWNDRLWMIGGDHHQGKYNHDVVSSADGTTWTVENADPPWEQRALQVSGVYDGKLWMVGGQTLGGLEEDYVYHNDVWSSVDGRNWVQVVPDAPASATRWAGRGLVNQLVEFNGRMWLVGGSTYTEALPRTLYPEVWSTTDGITWIEHSLPLQPLPGRAWPDVQVFDNRLWYMFGADNSGNHNAMWYSDDGDTWTQLPQSANPTPTSHAQGVAVGPDFMLYAGGNYTLEYNITSTWRLKAYRGEAVETWTERGAAGLTVTATAPEQRPVRDSNALGAGIGGVQFDGFDDVLTLPASELQPAGRSVFWVMRTPWTPAPDQWDTPPVINALATVVGDDDDQYCAVGVAEGGLHYVNSAGAWTSFRAGAGLAEGPGAVHLAGITHGLDGTVTGYIDGAAVGDPANVGYSEMNAWSRIGAGGYGVTDGSGFTGSLGAVVIVPAAVDAANVARINAWARGRFQTP